jgi:hypothetical protein
VQGQGLFTPRRRRLAWLGFVLLAAYAPLTSWLTRDDTYLMPLTVAGMIGYAIIVDDHLRRRAAKAATLAASAAETEVGPEAVVTETTRGRPVDDPGSVNNLDQLER